MPVPFLKTLVRDAGISMGRAEYFWDGAKAIAHRKGLKPSDKDYWRFVAGMAKKLAHSTKRKTMRGSKRTLTTEERDFMERMDRIVREIDEVLLNQDRG